MEASSCILLLALFSPPAVDDPHILEGMPKPSLHRSLDDLIGIQGHYAYCQHFVVGDGPIDFAARFKTACTAAHLIRAGMKHEQWGALSERLHGCCWFGGINGFV